MSSAHLLTSHSFIKVNSGKFRFKVKIKFLCRGLNEVKSELADVINYAFALSNRLEIDITETLRKKIKDNEKKYPINKIKGHYKKYSEIR